MSALPSSDLIADFVSNVRRDADEVWRSLESKGAVDVLGGIEYRRRIVGLRRWVGEGSWLSPEPMPPHLLAQAVGQLDGDGRLRNR